MSTALEVVPKELGGKISGVLERAQLIAITDQQSYEVAARFVLDCVNPVIQEIEATFGPIKQKAFAAHREACAQENRHLKPLLQAKAIATEKCLTYEAERRREEKERQRQAQLAAERQAEEDRERDIEYAEAAGATADEVQAIIAETVISVAPPTETGFQRVAGVTRAKPWTAEVTSKRELIRFLASLNEQYYNAYQHLLDVNQPALNSLARAQKELLSIPGVKVIRPL